MEVTAVDHPSWAAEKGVDVDDEIYAINGNPFMTMEPEDKIIYMMGRHFLRK